MQKANTLSMYEPYASALLLGLKTLETRSFNTKYRGELFIHTSGQIPRAVWDEYQKNSEFRMWVNLVWEFYNPEKAMLLRLTSRTVLPIKEFRAGFRLGVIRGKCTLTDSVPAWDLKQKFEAKGLEGVAAWQRNWALGDLSSNRFAWPVIDPVLFAEPIPAKGSISPVIWDAERQIPGFTTLSRAFATLPSTMPETLTFNPLLSYANA